jgi:hypothetical protein
MLVQDEEMVQTFPSHRTDESFTDGIRSRGFEGGFDLLGSAGSGHGRKLFTILLVIVANEILGTFSLRCGFPKLLSHPGIG